MADPTDEKIELLVRSVLAAVDARLVEVRSEIQAVAAETEQRNRDVIARLQELELRLQKKPTAPPEVAAPPATAMESAEPPMSMPSLDAMSAPLRVGATSDQVPVAATLPSAITLPPIPALTSAPPREPTGEPTAPVIGIAGATNMNS